MRCALDIAKYVINRCYVDLGKPITNLHLQKILYYLQGMYSAEFGTYLFSADIFAWKYGPVVPDIYYEYSDFLSEPITESYDNLDLDFSEKELIFINGIIDEKANQKARKLVEMTHAESPWKDAMADNGIGTLIRKETMKLYFTKHNSRPN